MGYDIYSMLPDKEKAKKYAKEATPWVFDEHGVYVGSDSVYYRMNIWGMGILRSLNEALGVSYLNEYLCDNSGRVIRSWECREAADHLNGLSDDEIREAVMEIVAGDTQLDTPEEIAAWVKEVRHWQEYLNLCSELKGCEVL